MSNVDGVGPVLRVCDEARAVAAAIGATNADVTVVDNGAYVRVRAPGRCRVTRAAIEAELGQPFELPGDLERIMPSFVGRFAVDEEEAAWELAAPALGRGEGP